MNFEPTKLKTTTSIAIPLIFSTLGFFGIYFQKVFCDCLRASCKCPSGAEIALSGLPLQIVSAIFLMIIIYSVWSLFQKKK